MPPNKTTANSIIYSNCQAGNRNNKKKKKPKHSKNNWVISNTAGIRIELLVLTLISRGNMHFLSLNFRSRLCFEAFLSKHETNVELNRYCKYLYMQAHKNIHKITNEWLDACWGGQDHHDKNIRMTEVVYFTDSPINYTDTFWTYPTFYLKPDCCVFLHNWQVRWRAIVDIAINSLFVL